MEFVKNQMVSFSNVQEQCIEYVFIPRFIFLETKPDYNEENTFLSHYYTTKWIKSSQP